MIMYLTILIFGIIHKLTHFIVKRILTKVNNISNQIKEIVNALSGPIMNLIIIIIANSIKINVFSGIMIMTSNLLIIIFSLIPIYPMDGGKILQEILKILFGEERGIKYTQKISFITIILTTIVASISILCIKSILILSAVMYLWYRYLFDKSKK